MNWGEIGTELILGIIGILIAGLGTITTYLINKYVKDAQLKKIVTSLNDLVQTSVKYVYQTYVEALKDKNMFDVEAQSKALEMCLEKINTNMPADVKKWLEENYSDVQEYLKTLIEAALATFKATFVVKEK